METYQQTLHSKMKLHHERHVYKRGAHKGDAPAGSRGKNDYRIMAHDDHMALRYYNTDILKAYPDGSITIHCDGFADRPTTKKYLNEWLYRAPNRLYLGSRRIMSQNQLIMATRTTLYRYYDGISFDANCAPTTPLKPFHACRINKEEVAELNKALDENGFKEMFKVLWGSAKVEDGKRPWDGGTWLYAKDRTDVFSMPDLYADGWQNMVGRFAFDSETYWDANGSQYTLRYIKRDPPAVWKAIMGWAKTHMYKTIETEVYEISK